MIAARSSSRFASALLMLASIACGGASVDQSLSGQGVTVAITPDLAALAPLAEQTFAATVSGAADLSVTWKVAEGAGGGSVTAGGAYTAPSSTGSYHVVATSNADPSKSATATVVVSTTTSPGFSIASGHPRLFWNASRLAQARTWLAANPFTPNSTDYFYLAWKHVVAGTDCSPAVAWAANYQVPSGQWQPTAVGSDEARWYGENAFIVYDWCYDQWTAQQRSDFLANIAGSGYGWNNFLAGINQQSWGSAAMVQSNYNWGNLRNDLEYAIATWSENAMAQTFMADGLTKRWGAFVASFPTCQEGGVGHEGTAYGTSMIPNSLLYRTIADGGRDLFSETPFYKQMTYSMIYSTTQAPTYHAPSNTTAYMLQPFGDDEHFSSGGTLHIRPYYQDWMRTASNLWSANGIGQHARQWVNTVGADAGTMSSTRFVLSQDTATQATPFTALPLDYYATVMKFFYGRKAWGNGATQFFWQYGAPPESCGAEGHSHFDAGNFHIWRGGRWLTRESTGYSDTIAGYAGGSGKDTKDALAHNLVVFAAPLATWGPSLPTSANGSTIMRRLESRSGYAYADVDLTRRYLWDDGHASLNTGAVVHVERESLFLRDLETTVMLDRVTTGAPTQGADAGKTAAQVVTTYLLHSEVNPTLEDASHLTITNGSQALRVTTLVPSSPTRRVVNEQSCSGCSAGIGQYRIEIDSSGDAQRYFLTVLQARDASGSNVTASVVDSSPGTPTSGTFTVTLQPSGGSPTVIVFNKGQTSGGGTVNLAGAGPTALASGVQAISYTDSGPAWGP